MSPPEWFLNIPATAPPENGVRRWRRTPSPISMRVTTGAHGPTAATREEIAMPLAKIHVLEGQYDEARLGRVSSAADL